ncbi:MAG: deoxyribodipyrimidine photo-lyase [Flavobacteriales bacterium]
MRQRVNLFWFRRDLRLTDNVGLYHALRGAFPVIPIFIFDTAILDELDCVADARVTFIYSALQRLQCDLKKRGSSLWVHCGKPLSVFRQICRAYDVQQVFANRDYEPYATERDTGVYHFLKAQRIGFLAFKDQVIFERDEVAKADGQPYTVYTPYSRSWKAHLKTDSFKSVDSEGMRNYLQACFSIPPLEAIGFQSAAIDFPPLEISVNRLADYHETRDLPYIDEGTSHLGVHLRFGTRSIRKLAATARRIDETFLNQLIWREFFMQILYHYPRGVTHNFYEKYDFVKWRNDEGEFKRWCAGQTGFPIVDAGMRQLNETGYMHNRVRMITASFLCKDLLVDWRWGEAYFAKKLLDYELASNNGNWQWAAGTGVDAAPYFRIFNPDVQARKFDPQGVYQNRWVKELGEPHYPKPMVNHKAARLRALEAYQKALH